MRIYRRRAFRRGASQYDNRGEILDRNGGEVENRIESLSIYVGKIGVDNFLLILVGVLYLAAYYQTQRDHADADLHWRTAVFFLVYGFTFDLYRLKSLRQYLLFGGMNFQLFRSGVLLISLLFLYDGLVHALLKKWREQRKTRRLKK